MGKEPPSFMPTELARIVAPEGIAVSIPVMMDAGTQNVGVGYVVDDAMILVLHPAAVEKAIGMLAGNPIAQEQYDIFGFHVAIEYYPKKPVEKKVSDGE